MQHQLLSAVPKRPTRADAKLPSSPQAKPDPGKANLRMEYASVCRSIGSPERVAKLRALLGHQAFRDLSIRDQRRVLRAIEAGGAKEGQLEAVGELIMTPAFRQVIPAIRARLLAEMTRLVSNAIVRSLLNQLVRCGGFSVVDPSTQQLLISYTTGPKAGAASADEQEAELSRWWSTRAKDLKALLVELDKATSAEQAQLSFGTHYESPSRQLWTMAAADIPGALIVCFGSPADSKSLAYARVIALTEDGIKARIKSPVEPIRQGWSKRVDPKGIKWDSRSYLLSPREERDLIRWIEDSHVVEGPKSGAGKIGSSPAGTFEAALQLDVQIHKVVQSLTAHRGTPAPTSGQLVRGKPLGVKNSKPGQAA